MRAAVVCAVPAGEARLVAALDAPGTGLTVVRRCVDLAEVTALAIAGVGRVVVLGSSLAGVDRGAVGRLRAAGLGVVLVAEEGDAARSRALGADGVVALEAAASELVAAVGEAARASAASAPEDRVPGAAPAAGASADPGTGRLVAVWGPHGSPGRTTVAVTLASELAALGESALLVDADTWGAAVAQTLGLLDESPGLAAAARAAGSGALDVRALDRLCPVVEPGLRVLTGLSRPDRWRELSPSGLDLVWETARSLAGWTVVDCGFSLEGEDTAGFEAMLGPRRNGATTSALGAADVVVVVGAGEPLGIQRLVNGLTDLSERGLAAPEATRVVLVNRVRASAAGPRPQEAVTEALVRYARVADVVVVPDDRPALDRAMLEGLTLRAAAPSSPARQAIAALASTLSGRDAPSSPRRRAGLVRRRDAGRG